jgi:hypothetical protein
MPIKSFTFAFKLDAKELLEYVVNRNMAVDIHATGTRRPEVELIPSPEQPLALPPPPIKKGARNPDLHTNSRGIVLAFMARHPEEKYSNAVLRALLQQTGYSPNTLHGMIFIMHKARLVKKAGKGHYRITAKGLKKLEAE